MIAGVEHAARKIETIRLSLGGALFDFRSARITESEQLRDFVERFAGRVVHRSAKNAVVVHAAHFHQQSVAAAHDQRNVPLDLIAAEKRRKQMAFQMINGEIRFARAHRETLCNRRADHQRARQARPGRRRECIDAVERASGRSERMLEQPRRVHEMIARSHFRHHAAVCFVFGLRRDFAR